MTSEGARQDGLYGPKILSREARYQRSGAITRFCVIASAATRSKGRDSAEWSAVARFRLRLTPRASQQISRTLDRVAREDGKSRRKIGVSKDARHRRRSSGACVQPGDIADTVRGHG
jgi:hypothetical protein